MSATPRNRVVCTLGPHNADGTRPQDHEDYVVGLVRAGMDVARINLSHARGAADFLAGRNPEYALERLRMAEVRTAADAVGEERHVATMLDLQGIKIRLYVPGGKKVVFAAGERLRMRVGGVSDETDIACDGSPRLVRALRAALDEHGSVEVAIADGDPMLRCDGLEDDVALLAASEAGVLRHRKGVTFRGVELGEEPPLPLRDRIDLAAFALPAVLRGDADLLALSFTRNAADVLALRAFSRSATAYFRDGVEPDDTDDSRLFARLLELRPGLCDEYGDGDPDDVPVVAKLETRAATENVEGILSVANAVMVARGDLGLQCRPEDVPRLQKDIIREARLLGRPAIVATQMLGSMERAPEPTRAEASDVFNAVLDGADALMLSGETALGQRPHQAVRTLVQVSVAACDWRDARRFGRGMQLNHMRMDIQTMRRSRSEDDASNEVTDRMTVEAVRIAEGLNAEAIVAVTRSGQTARNVARFDPLLPLIAIVPSVAVARSLALTGSVRPVVVAADDTRESLRLGLVRALEVGFLERGDRVLVVGARDDDPAGVTSVISIRRVGRD